VNLLLYFWEGGNLKNDQNSLKAWSSEKNLAVQFRFILVFSLILFLYLSYCEFYLAGAQTLIKGTEDNTGENVINLNETGDIEITAKVQIEQLLFRKVGNTTVHFPGNQQRKLTDKSVRTNLPADIKANHIYRNVKINLQIISAFVNINQFISAAEREDK
jgi:hypothetical protein